MTHTGATPRFLVTGTTVYEAVVHHETGRQRIGLGGVAATMALALAQAGNHVTLLTSLGSGPNAVQSRRLLKDSGIHTALLNLNHIGGHATIVTKNGEPTSAKGHWPKPPGLAQSIATLASQHDCHLVDTNIQPQDLHPILEAHPFTIINATTTSRARAILWNNRIHRSLVTMNKAEAQSLAKAAHVSTQKDFLRSLNTDRALVTLGPEGWRLYATNAPEISSPAPAVPDHTDFVGCGDYATAGIAHALLRDLDPVETVNAFISRKLEANSLPPTL